MNQNEPPQPQILRDEPGKDGPAWITSDGGVEYVGELVGNRAGMEALKSAIERALEEGRAPGPGAGEWEWIRIVEGNPQKHGHTLTFKSKLRMAGCLLIALFCLFTFLTGLLSLPNLLMK